MSDQERYAEVRLEPTINGGEEVVIPLRPGDDIPAVLRAVADAWDAANTAALSDVPYEVDGLCGHVWHDSDVPGYRLVCLLCGGLR